MRLAINEQDHETAAIESAVDLEEQRPESVGSATFSSKVGEVIKMKEKPITDIFIQDEDEDDETAQQTIVQKQNEGDQVESTQVSA